MNARTAQAASERAGLGGPGGPRGRRRWVTVTVAGVVVVLLVATGAVWLTGALRTHGPSGSGYGAGLYGTSTAPVRRETLSAQTAVSATLGYAGSYTVTVPGSSSPGSGPGTFTWLPPAGRVIRQGQVLYRTNNGVPTYLLYGRVPAWRELTEGMRGADVAQLNHDLVRLGYAGAGYIGGPGWDYFSWDTRYGLERLQARLGLAQTGTLPLGQAVFLPGAARITGPGATTVLGGAAAPGTTALTATSTRPVVTVALGAGQQTEVKKGDKVSVTLPDGTTTPGVISSVGTVATSSSASSAGSGGAGGAGGQAGSSDSGSSSGSGSATITVLVSLTDPKAAGRLDQAPVTVEITTGSASNALVVPVTALLAQPGGKYEVEQVTPGGRHRLVPVTPGMFDDASGLVQVTGTSLAVGDHVVMPAA